MTRKILLVGINSQYVHTNIAIRYLKNFVEQNSNEKITLYETNINNQFIAVLNDIFEERPDILIFSTYIWNRDFIFDLVSELKKVLPNTKIVLGGPEVSYEWDKIMKNTPEIDNILVGEGEKILLNFLTKDITQTKGVVYREEGDIKYNGNEKLIHDLDIVPFPYSETELQDIHKIFYYESSRGCPFSCSYCMSSIDKTVRYYSLERTKKDLKKFIDSPATLVKFVDRTFNLKKSRYLGIWRFLLENYRKNLTFHFEINANIFNDETIEFLKKVPIGFFQFEVGVQTINTTAMKSINRVNYISKLANNITQINKNIHMHLDLIAGLPYDTYEIFKNSFNYVYNLRPDMIQLGFLKLLRGTEMFTKIKEFDYKYLSKTPYEIFSNKFISFSEILKLKKIEQILDFYYNSHNFPKSVDYILNNFYDNQFNFYEDVADYFDKLGYFKISHKVQAIFNFLYDFYIYKDFRDKDIFLEYLKYDFINYKKPSNFPIWFNHTKDGEMHDKLIKKYNFRTTREGHKNSELADFNYNIIENCKEKISIFFNYETKENILLK